MNIPSYIFFLKLTDPDNIRETLNTRITSGVGDIKIVFNKK